MNIKDLRKAKKLTQLQAAELTGIPLRTYKEYENSASKVGTIKYNYILDCLNGFGVIDETHGVLTVDDIAAACAVILPQYDVEYCYLFGSYAKNEATCESDVDLLVATSVTGLKFYGLAEQLREQLHKTVDLLDLKQLNNNSELLNNILKYGMRIYEK